MKIPIKKNDHLRHHKLKYHLLGAGNSANLFSLWPDRVQGCYPRTEKIAMFMPAPYNLQDAFIIQLSGNCPFKQLPIKLANLIGYRHSCQWSCRFKQRRTTRVQCGGKGRNGAGDVGVMDCKPAFFPCLKTQHRFAPAASIQDHKNRCLRVGFTGCYEKRSYPCMKTMRCTNSKKFW